MSVSRPETMEKSFVRGEVLNRLKTIKGHITGIEKMIEEGKTCEEILLQIAAVRSSIEKTGLMILEEHSVDCLFGEIRDDKAKEKIESVISSIIKYMK
ncbi:MAG: metal-sensitive transcriptional regulator [Clostridia bacterium]